MGIDIVFGVAVLLTLSRRSFGVLVFGFPPMMMSLLDLSKAGMTLDNPFALRSFRFTFADCLPHVTSVAKSLKILNTVISTMTNVVTISR